MKRQSRSSKSAAADEQSEARRSSTAVDDATMEEGLAAIYGEDCDDLHVVSRGPSVFSRWLGRIVLGLAGLTVVVFLGYFFSQRFITGQTNEEPLVMAFNVPESVVSGQRVTLELTYANPTSIPLASLEIDVNLPPTFRVAASTPAPTNAEELVWNIGTLSANTDGKISVEGVWVAEVSSTSSLQALAAYKPANFNSDFHDIVTAAVLTSGSSTTVELQGPTTASPGKELTYTVVVVNTGAELLSGAELTLALPEGFFVTKSTPELPAGGEATWKIGDLTAGFSQPYSVTGSFASDVMGSQALTASLVLVDGSLSAKQTEATVFTDVTGSPLQLDMIMNGGSGDINADPLSTLRISLRLRNAGSEAIDGIAGLLDFQSEGELPIAWKDASLDGGRLTADGVVFDASVIGAIEPGERLLLNLVFPLKEAQKSEDSVFTVAFSAAQAGVTVQTSPATVTLNSDARLSSEARYYDQNGAPLGSGPLPPTVGEKTSYRMLWTLTNGVHSLEDVTVSATLPSHVTWDNFSNAELGNVAFDEGSRTVTWTIVALPSDVQEIQANFSVSITPVEEDVGEFVDLMSAPVMRAKDSETQASLERSGERETTELPDDELAQGKGAVIGE